MRRHRTVDRTLELLDLAAGDVLETGPHPLHGVGLLPLRLFGELAPRLAEAGIVVAEEISEIPSLVQERLASGTAV